MQCVPLLLKRRIDRPSIYDLLSSRESSSGAKGDPTKDRPAGVWGLLAARPKRRGRRPTLPTGLWSDLYDKTDVTFYKPKLGDHVEIKEFRLRWSNDYAMASNRRELIFYRLDINEVPLMRRMDGTRTVAELVVDNLSESGEFDLSSVADLVRQLDYGGFLEQPFQDVEKAIAKAIAPPLTPARRMKEFFRKLEIEWKGAERMFIWIYNHGLKHAFKRWVQVILGLISVAGLIAFTTLFFRSHFKLLEHSPATEGMILIGLGYILTLIHETAHASVLIHKGRRVKSAGFMIYFGSTAFFIDSSDGLMMDRGDSIRMSFAGPYSEAVAAGIVAMVAFAFPDAAFSNTLYKFALLNYYVIFLNLVPFLELDGYWIFSNAVQVPELRKKSFQFLRHELIRKIRSRERPTRMQTGLAVYAVLGIAFTIFWINASFYFWRRIFGGIISALWNGGIVSRALLFVLAFVILGPAIRALIKVGRSVLKRVRSFYDAVGFKLQTQWRVEAAEMIEALPMFDDLDDETLSDLAGRVRLRGIPGGTPIVRQGELGDAFYLVRRGALEVVEEDLETQNERVLRVLGKGEAFGELGLATASPRRATVRAVDDAEVFEIDKATFDRLLLDTISLPEFAPTIQAMREIRQLPCFSHLENDEIADLLEMGEWVNFEPGDVIIRQGEPGDAFYAVESGKADVIRGRKVIHAHDSGSYFGEVALLLDVPRTATVKAVTAVTAFMVTRKGFNRLLKRAFKRGTLNPQTPVRLVWEH